MIFSGDGRGHTKGLGAQSTLGVGETEEVVATPPEANLPQLEEVALDSPPQQGGIVAPVDKAVSWVVTLLRPRPQYFDNAGGQPRVLFSEALPNAWDSVERLQVIILAEWGERNEKCFALPVEEARLEEGCQKLESLVHVAKVVYDHDIAEVERLNTALEGECDEVVAAREQAVKAAEEL
ncbi:hypothetical protein E2562_017122 [Oryza meyeriana var. granulata]|uniref:Uncharacterized protein n=1 Tax=Oryza meyeriana var. granulata TaxID=110450 RepID=A0A6G1DXT7_9ORYZ|nr:hypothetical protein E2562_017122 [Oryza meyeriana var. granulata]